MELKRQIQQDKMSLIRQMRRPVVVMNQKDVEILKELREERKEGLIIAITESSLIKEGEFLVHDYDEGQNLIWESEIIN